MRIVDLQRMARRHVRTPEEAEDVVQDVLLAAVAAGRRLDDAQFGAWARGAIRRRAAFVARTAGRQARRERLAEPPPADAVPVFPESFVRGLSPALREVARLVAAGLERAEIAWLLELDDTAFRQRLSALRLRWRRSGLTPDDDRKADTSLPLGLMRRAMRRRLSTAPGRALGSHDPDGHLLIFSAPPSQNGRPRQQGDIDHPPSGDHP